MEGVRPEHPTRVSAREHARPPERASLSPSRPSWQNLTFSALQYMAKGGDYRVDIGALRAEYPGLLTFEKWLDC